MSRIFQQSQISPKFMPVQTVKRGPGDEAPKKNLWATLFFQARQNEIHSYWGGGGLKREASETRKNVVRGACPRENFS